jgi:hypothetical protein
MIDNRNLNNKDSDGLPGIPRSGSFLNPRLQRIELTLLETGLLDRFNSDRTKLPCGGEVSTYLETARVMNPVRRHKLVASAVHPIMCGRVYALPDP